MKKAIALIITDLHLGEKNFDAIEELCFEAVEKAVDLGLSRIFIGGDVFDSRKAQPLKSLLAWQRILDAAQVEDVEFCAISGNHDKTDYASEDSYLDVFIDHPNFFLVRDYDSFDVGKNGIMHMVPFFEEKETYPDYIKLAKTKMDANNYLLTHISINGVRNNDGSKVEETFSKSNFSQFDKVFVGHYHDKQEIGDNIYYIGAITQKNYGEDQDKGFTALYDDGSHELIQSTFTKFNVVKIDLDTVSDAEMKIHLAENANSKDHVRFKFTGSKEKIIALDKSKFDDLDIDVKCDYKNVDIEVSYKDAQNFSGFNKVKIKKEWKEFCENNEDIDEKIGSELLKKAM